jgi:hypothetical protein
MGRHVNGRAFNWVAWGMAAALILLAAVWLLTSLRPPA